MDDTGHVKLSGLGFYQILGKELFESVVSAAVLPVRSGPKRFFISDMEVMDHEIKKSNKWDFHSDIYSMGINLYTLLTTYKPDPIHYVPVCDTVPGLNQGWDILLRRSLDYNVQSRYPSMHQFYHDLERLEQLCEREQSQPAEQFAAAQPRRRISMMSLLLSLVGLTLTLCTGVATWYWITSRPRVEQVMSEDKANLQLYLPSDGVVKFPTLGLELKSKDKRLLLNVNKIHYEIEAHIPFYETGSFTIDPSEKSRFDLDVKPKRTRFRVMSAPNTTVKVYSAETDEVVFTQQSQSNGQTLIEGERIIQGVPYYIMLSRPDYQSFKSEVFTLESDSGAEFIAEMEPLPGSLSLTTKPDNAKVFINGVDYGTVPVNVSTLPVKEELKLSVTAPGYHPHEETFYLKANEQREMNLGSLKPKQAFLHLAIFWADEIFPSKYYDELVIKVDGEPVEWNPDQAVPILEGTRLITIKHKDSYGTQFRLNVKEGDEPRQRITLIPLPAWLKINITPEVDYTLRLNDDYLRKNEAGFFEIKANETHTMIVEADHYERVERSFKFEPNTKNLWNVSLNLRKGPEEGQDYSVPIVEMDLKWIPSGRFLMGSPSDEAMRNPEEGPQTIMTLSYGFWMASHEVTQAAFEKIMGYNGSNRRQADCPVEGVSREEAMRFCKALQAQESQYGRIPEGYEYRLPSEVEWEYAARAGTQTPFWFGEEADSIFGNFQGTYPDQSDITVNRDARTVPVKSYEPNAFGLYDMHGNVSEWCLDRFKARLPGGEHTDYFVPRSVGKSDELYTVKGAGYEDWADIARSGYRQGVFGRTKSRKIGFRVVLAPEYNEPQQTLTHAETD